MNFDPQIDRDRRLFLARQSVTSAPDKARTMLDLAQQRADRIRNILAIKTGDFDGQALAPMGTDPRAKLYADLDAALEVVADARQALVEAEAAVEALPPLAPVVHRPILSAHEIEARRHQQDLIDDEEYRRIARERRAILDRDEANLIAMRAAEAAEAQRLADTRPRPATTASISIEANRANLTSAVSIAGNT